MLAHYCYQMPTLFVAFIMLVAVTGSADDLGTLVAAARRYVASMKAVPALPEAPNCSETIAKAREYAAAKAGYYEAARQAMPTLLQIAKRQKAERTYGVELTEIFLSFGEGRDEEVSEMLNAKLNRCPSSDQRDQACLPVEQSKETAERFIKDFGRPDGA